MIVIWVKLYIWHIKNKQINCVQVLACYFVMLSEKRFLTIVGYGNLKKLQHDQANCHYLFLSVPTYTLRRIKGCVEQRNHVANGNKGEKTLFLYSLHADVSCAQRHWGRQWKREGNRRRMPTGYPFSFQALRLYTPSPFSLCLYTF